LSYHDLCLAHAGSTSLPHLGLLGLLLGNTLGQNLRVLVGSVLGLLGLAALERDSVALVLETLRSDETLDTRSLGVWLGTLLLGLDLTTNDELADIVFLAETEEAADLGRALGTQALGVYGIREARNVVVALLDNGQSKDGQVHGNNASTNRLSLALTRAAWAVAAVAVGEEKSDTGWVHDTLLHRKTLLVVAASDLEDVALELVADAVARHFLTHAAVHEDTQLALIFHLDQLLRAVGWEGNIELHLDWMPSRCSSQIPLVRTSS